MFSDIGKNKDIILGVYKKLKSYYHYNKNYIFMKSKLAEFEYDSLEMDNSLLILANLLSDPYNNKNKQLVNGWIEKMDFFVMPKKFTSNNKNNDTFISNNASKSEKINQVNFFIDMPIELYILETLWTVLIGKLLLDKGIMTDCSYGNCINEDVLYNKQEDFLSSINFEKNNLFKIYFPQYCKWKNDTIKAIEFYNHKKRSQLLVSLDIKGFYYSIFWKFDILENLIGENDIYANILFLTEIIQRIFEKYTYKIGEYRNISQKVENKEYVLPIGMFSSMLLSNLYLSKFDIEMINNKNVLHYGRYVDDMLLVLEATDEEKNINEKTVIEEYLIKKNKILSHKCDDIYILNGFSSLQIQKQKVKIFYLDKINSKSLIIQLKKTISYPSQMNIIPDTELRLSDFEEAIYLKMNLSSETKIRDIKQFEIDRYQLGIHMWQIVMNNRAKKDCITIEERAARQHEGDCILKFFKGSKALEYSSNWINAMYYFLLTAETNQKSWQLFQDNIRNAIDKLQICKIQDVYKHKNEMIKKRIKTSLHIYFDICISTVLSLYPNFCKVKDQNIFLLAKKIRKANLFNHYLVSYPLINYADDLDDTIDLTNLSPTVFQKITFKIKESNKSKLSPRFINLEEIFQFVFMCQATRGGNFYLDSENLSVFQKIEYIIDYFYSVNHIYRKKETDIKLSIENDIKDGYIVQKIQIGDNVECKENIKVAIANVKLNVKRCCLGLEW